MVDSTLTISSIFSRRIVMKGIFRRYNFYELPRPGFSRVIENYVFYNMWKQVIPI